METTLRLWDFGDSGAFAEYPVPQYPNGLGDPARNIFQQQQKQKQASSSNVSSSSSAATTANQNTTTSTSALMIVQTGQSSLNAHTFNADDLLKPDEEKRQEIEDDTRRVLEMAKTRNASSSSSSTSLVSTSNKNKNVVSAASGNTNKGSAIPLVRSPTRRATAAEKAQFHVPSAIFASRNPKAKLIDVEERMRHDGRTYITHDFSNRHDEMSKIATEAGQQAERAQRDRSRDEERQREKERQEERNKLVAKIQADLTSGRNQYSSISSSTSTSTSNNQNQNQNAPGTTTRRDREAEYEQRNRELQERRKLHRMQSQAEKLGVSVEELYAQDDDIILNQDQQQSATATSVDAAATTTISNAHDRFVDYRTAAKSKIPLTSTTSAAATGGATSATMARVFETANRDRLLQEQQLQSSRPEEQANATTTDSSDSDSDEDVFGVGKQS